MKKLALTIATLFLALTSFQILAETIQINPATNGDLQLNLVINSSSMVANNILGFGLSSQTGGFTFNKDGSIENVDMGSSSQLGTNPVNAWVPPFLKMLSSQYSQEMKPYDGSFYLGVQYNNGDVKKIALYQAQSATSGEVFTSDSAISIGTDANIVTTYNQSNNTLTITMNIAP